MLEIGKNTISVSSLVMLKSANMNVGS